MSPSDSRDAADTLIGSVFADRYLVQSRLGKGGMAVVYKAQDRNLGRDVALKVLRTDVAPDPVAAKRLIREARAAASLHHPHIITMHDVGERDGIVFVVMEVLVGRPMSDMMESEGSVSVERAVDMCEQIASALVVAHHNGIIHRDIKPENLFLIDHGSSTDFVKMLDFSIAKLPTQMVTAALTRAGSVFGTPHYMAPEQVEGKQAVPQTDLYALGAVLYELISGEPPYDGPSVIDILLKHVKSPSPHLNVPGVRLPPGLDDMVQQLLAKKPQDRPESAQIVRERLARMLTELRAEKETARAHGVADAAAAAAGAHHGPPSIAGVQANPGLHGARDTDANTTITENNGGSGVQQSPPQPAHQFSPPQPAPQFSPPPPAMPTFSPPGPPPAPFSLPPASTQPAHAARPATAAAFRPGGYAEAATIALQLPTAPPPNLPGAAPPKLPGAAPANLPTGAPARKFSGFDEDEPEKRTMVGVGMAHALAAAVQARSQAAPAITRAPSAAHHTAPAQGHPAPAAPQAAAADSATTTVPGHGPGALVAVPPPPAKRAPSVLSGGGNSAVASIEAPSAVHRSVTGGNTRRPNPPRPPSQGAAPVSAAPGHPPPSVPAPSHGATNASAFILSGGLDARRPPNRPVSTRPPTDTSAVQDTLATQPELAESKAPPRKQPARRVDQETIAPEAPAPKRTLLWVGIGAGVIGLSALAVALWVATQP